MVLSFLVTPILLQKLTIDSGVKPQDVVASGEDALRAQRVIEAAIRSFETRSVIDLS